MKEELGSLWGRCGLDSEWRDLRTVLLHRPGPEMEAVGRDPAGSLMLDVPDPGRMRGQHDALAQAYRTAGVEVRYVDPPVTPPPNQLFAADLLAMTPEGAILGRPASEVRAGEERWVSRALAEAGIPILRSVGGGGTFEGADLMWLDPRKALLAEGLRTNREGAAQVEAVLREMGLEVHRTHLPPGTMHLMGQLRIPDRDLALVWPRRLPEDARGLLTGLGFSVFDIPDEEEARTGFALNFVTLAPRCILMPAGNPVSRAFYRDLGIECVTVDVSELAKAAGGIGCLTGILERERADPE
jgi:N-dimethylarginine dimethylaminohydrolase